MDARQQRVIQRRGWDRASTCYEQYWQRQLEPAHDLLLSAVDLQPGDDVLDVACGSGALTMRLATIAGSNGSVLATDLSPKMTAATAAQAADTGVGNVRTLCCDAEQLDFEGEFDVALCSLGLMYVPDPPAAIDGLRRSLRPGGRVGLLVWGDRSQCGWAALFGIVDARVASDVCPRFFALGGRGVLSRLLEHAGLVDVSETRLNITLDYCDDAQALGAAFLGGPVALAYGMFDADTRRQVSDEYLRSIAPFRGDGGAYRVPGEFVVVTARRP
jgi:SAM-dependent methyltransferase